jgi:hypothetical protein
MRPRLVMLSGVCAGIGKSTLAAGIARTVEAHAGTADLFGEEQLFTRPEWTHVAAGFRSKDFPTGPQFLQAYTTTIRTARSSGSWLILDWFCGGMAGDLPWALADHSLLVDLCRAVRELATDMDPVLIDLTGDARVATERAMAERGKPWIRRYTQLAADRGIADGTPLDLVTAWARSESAQQASDLLAMRRSGWPVIEIDAMHPAADVLATAWTTLMTI